MLELDAVTIRATCKGHIMPFSADDLGSTRADDTSNDPEPTDDPESTDDSDEASEGWGDGASAADFEDDADCDDGVETSSKTDAVVDELDNAEVSTLDAALSTLDSVVADLEARGRNLNPEAIVGHVVDFATNESDAVSVSKALVEEPASDVVDYIDAEIERISEVPDDLTDDPYVDPDDQSVDDDLLDEMKSLYLDNPDAALREQFDPNEATREAFAQWTGQQDTSSSSIQPPDTAPDSADPDFDDKRLSAFDFADVDGVGRTTADRIDGALEEEDVEYLHEALDFDYSAVHKVGDKTAAEIREALEHEKPPGYDADGGSSTDDTDSEPDECGAEESVEEAIEAVQRVNDDPSNDDTTELLINCLPIDPDAEYELASQLFEPLKEQIAAEEDLAHFSLMEYGGEHAALASLVRQREDLWRGKTIVVDARRRWSEGVIEALRPAADRVVKSM